MNWPLPFILKDDPGDDDGKDYYYADDQGDHISLFLFNAIVDCHVA
jgi:hypothetical protein